MRNVNLRECAIITVFVTLSFLFICLGFAALSVRDTAIRTQLVEDQLATIAYHNGLATQKTILQAGTTVKAVGEHADRVLTVAGIAAAEATKVSRKQGDYLNKEVPEFFAKLNKLLDGGTDVVAQLGMTVNTANEALKPVKPLIEETTVTVKAAGVLLANPDIPLMISHGNSMATSGDKIVKDVSDYIHPLVHPDPVHGWKKVERDIGMSFTLSVKILEALYYSHGVGLLPFGPKP